MNRLPALTVMSVKVPVADLAQSRRWYADVFGLREEMEWPDHDGVVRGIAFAPLGGVVLALREHPEAAAATRRFGFLNIGVPDRTGPGRLRGTPRPARREAHAGDLRRSRPADRVP